MYICTCISCAVTQTLVYMYICNPYVYVIAYYMHSILQDISVVCEDEIQKLKQMERNERGTAHVGIALMTIQFRT